MKAKGNEAGLIKEWIALAHQWALDHNTPDAAAIRSWLPYFQPRPFYTAAELVPLWPALIVALDLTDRPPRYEPNRLAMELDYGKLPCLKNSKDDLPWFRNPANRNNLGRFYIVERVHYWNRRAWSQREFEDGYYGR